MDEEKLTNDELLLLEKALQLMYRATTAIENMPDYYDHEYHSDVDNLAWKLGKIFDREIDVFG